MWSTIRVPLHGDNRHADDRAVRKPLFQIVVFRFTLGQAKPPSIIVDHDRDVIRIVESLCAAFKGCVVKVPPR